MREGSDASWSDMRRRGGVGRRWRGVVVVVADNSLLAAGRERNPGLLGMERVKSSRNGRSTAGICTGRRGWRWGP